MSVKVDLMGELGNIQRAEKKRKKEEGIEKLRGVYLSQSALA